MAQGALANSLADLSVAITGVAGPGGGTDAKPVGLVHFAAARIGHDTISEKHLFGDIGRSVIRDTSVDVALKLLLRLASA
jgi:nicotinamide-nucleotide amidase